MTAGYRYGLIAVLGIAMGIQNASARKIAVPDLTTTVLTLTITGIAADSALAGGQRIESGPSAARRSHDARGRFHRCRSDPPRPGL